MFKRYIYALSIAVLMAVVAGCGGKDDNNNNQPTQPIVCMPGTGVGNIPCQPSPGMPYPPNNGTYQQGIHYQGTVVVSNRQKAEDALNCQVYVTPYGGSYNACNVYGISVSNLVVDVYFNNNNGGTATVRSHNVAPYSTIGATTGGGTVFAIGNGAGVELDIRAGNTANTLGIVLPTFVLGTTQSATVNLTFNGQQIATGTLTLRPY